MKIEARTLKGGESHECGYPTCGDWTWWDNGEIEATVSPMGDPDSEFVVLLHEIIECYLCHKMGISHIEVSDFDRMFEQERAEGKHGPDDEPGDDPRAPYRWPHQCATLVERLVLHLLGGYWGEHERLVNNG